MYLELLHGLVITQFNQNVRGWSATSTTDSLLEPFCSPFKVFNLLKLFFLARHLEVKQCQEYNGNICDKDDYDEPEKRMLVYVDPKYSQRELEKELQRLVDQLENIAHISCQSFLKYVLCNRFFPVCRRENGKPRYVQSVCRDTCGKAKYSLCYDDIKGIPELSERFFGASCMTLPTKGCFSFEIPCK